MKRELPVQPVGLIGLGLMGRGIATCLLSREIEVYAYNRTASRAREAVDHIGESLDELVRRKMIPRANIRGWKKRFHIVDSLAGLAPSRFVVESVKEDLALKRRIYEEVEAAVSPRAVIASNTSSLPITSLQEGRRHPERFIGMHWGEPAQIMRYLEVIPGEKTSRRTLQITLRLGEICGKEPTPLNRDIQGFISNRMMYAMLREACYLVESGIADIETVDRSFRNDIGYWATLAGPFRWMDLTGIPAYQWVAEGLIPKLDSSSEVPKVLRDMVASGAQGVGNAKGFYKYTKASAKKWEKAWVDFTYEIRKLADRFDGKKIG